mgnify:CR=1 FL=1
MDGSGTASPNRISIMAERLEAAPEMLSETNRMSVTPETAAKDIVWAAIGVLLAAAAKMTVTGADEYVAPLSVEKKMSVSPIPRPSVPLLAA